MNRNSRSEGTLACGLVLHLEVGHIDSQATGGSHHPQVRQVEPWLEGASPPDRGCNCLLAVWCPIFGSPGARHGDLGSQQELVSFIPFYGAVVLLFYLVKGHLLFEDPLGVVHKIGNGPGVDGREEDFLFWGKPQFKV